MGPLVLTVVAAVCAVKATMGLSRSAWAYRIPCAVVSLWVGAMLVIPVSAIAALLILAVDPHTFDVDNLWSTVTAAVASAILLAVTIRVAARFRVLNRAARVRRRRHEMLIDLFGVHHPEIKGVDVIPDGRLFAYSVPCIVSGRIVLSQGTLDQLDEAPLRAVLAHERAHLYARHHLVLQLATAVHQSFPGWKQGAALVARITDLIEMAADCYARRRVGQQPAITALATLADTPIPDGVLAAGGRAVTLRLDQLRQRPNCCETARAKSAYAAAVGLVVMSPAVVYLNHAIDLCPWTTA